MKFGIRTPSLKKSISARTTGRLKRTVKKAVIPGYGKKGMGWIKNPKKAAYNAVYHRTTVGVGDIARGVIGNQRSASGVFTGNEVPQKRSPFDFRTQQPTMNYQKPRRKINKWYYAGGGAGFLVLLIIICSLCGNSETTTASSSLAASSSKAYQASSVAAVVVSSSETSQAASSSQPVSSETVSSSEQTTSSEAPKAAASSAESKAKSSPSKKATPSVITLNGPIETVQNGSNATISIKGKPSTEYNIQVYYSAGASKADGLRTKTSDSNGNVSWTWKVGQKTKPGTHKIVISGGDSQLETSFTTKK